MGVSGTISLRLPDEVRERLDRLASERKRSRSFLIVEAIERHLAEQERHADNDGERFAVTRSLLRRTRIGLDAETIDARIRMARDDD